MSNQGDSEGVSSPRKLAEGIIAELFNIRRFLLAHTSHPDWPTLVRDMPGDLRTLLDKFSEADQVRTQSSDRCYVADSRHCHLEGELKVAESHAAETGELNLLRERLVRAEEELTAAELALDSAEQGLLDAGRALSEKGNSLKMAAYEQQKKQLWLSEHHGALVRMRGALERALMGQLHRLEALPGRLGTRYDPEIRANSATKVLLRLAGLVEEKPHLNQTGLDLDQLRVDVVHELSGLVPGDNLGTEQAGEIANSTSTADRLLAAVRRLVDAGKFDATQDELARLAKCNSRELRRGSGQKIWRSYIGAGVRPPDEEGPPAAQSRQQRVIAEKVREDRRGRAE